MVCSVLRPICVALTLSRFYPDVLPMLMEMLAQSEYKWVIVSGARETVSLEALKRPRGEWDSSVENGFTKYPKHRGYP